MLRLTLLFSFFFKLGRGFPGIENDVQFGKVHISISGDEEDELERLLERFEKAGARITKRIERRPWGLKDFEVRGMLLCMHVYGKCRGWFMGGWMDG